MGTQRYDFLASSQALDDITIDDVILSNWGTIDEPFKAYYGSIPASAVGEWYQRYGNRLFAKNIRYYKGSTDVNQATIEDPLHQITLDEAIIAQACSIDELSIVSIAWL